MKRCSRIHEFIREPMMRWRDNIESIIAGGILNKEEDKSDHEMIWMLKIVEFTSLRRYMHSVKYSVCDNNLASIRKIYNVRIKGESEEVWVSIDRAKAEFIAHITKADFPRKIIDDESQKIIQRVDNLRECEIEIYWCEKELIEHDLKLARNVRTRYCVLKSVRAQWSK